MGSIPECATSLGRRKEQAHGCLCSAPPTELCLPAATAPPKRSTHRGLLSEDTRRRWDPQPRREHKAAAVCRGLGKLLQPVSWQSRLAPGEVPASSSSFKAGSPKSWPESPTASSEEHGTLTQQPCSQAACSTLPWSWGVTDPPEQKVPSPRSQAHQDLPGPPLSSHTRPVTRDGQRHVWLCHLLHGSSSQPGKRARRHVHLPPSTQNRSDGQAGCQPAHTRGSGARYSRTASGTPAPL